MIDWTESQKAAIIKTEGRVYVSAAAGSGKTAVLVERIVGIIADRDRPVPADRLLVVTFTRAAAAEMRARIKKRIDEMIRERPGDDYLRRQSLLLRRANISTVHAFCMSLLREFWTELDIPPDFTLASDLFLEDMRQTALRRAAEKLYADESSRFREFSDLFGRARSDTEPLAMVDNLDRFLSDLADPEDWREKCIEELLSKKPVGETTVGGLLFDYAEEAAESALSLMKEGMQIVETDEELYDKYSEAFLYDLNFLEELLGYIKARDWDICRAMLESYYSPRLKPVRGAEESLKNAAKSCRDGAREIIGKVLSMRCFPVSEEVFYADGVRVANAMEILFSAVDIFREELAAIKKKRKMLDYGDLEQLTIRLLGKDCLAREEILSRFDYVLVDEYQDTNEVQDLLFSRLTEQNGNLFAVGDIKQSIYSFRRADPEIFLEKRKNALHYKEDGARDSEDIHIPLTHNFRSCGAVIDAVNAVFGAVMTGRVGDVDYKDGEALTTTRTEESQEAGIEIRLVEDETGDEISEARELARLIGDMLDSGYPVEEMREGTVTRRRCRPGDFCILLRARTKTALFEEQLAGRGIPVNSDGGGTFFENSEIEVLLALLRIIDNPKRDVEMAAVLLSPLFSFSPDDLLRLKQPNRYRDLYSAMLESEDKKIGDFLETLAGWRLRAAKEPVDILLQDIVDETDAELLLTAGDGYLRRRNNIRILIENAAELSSAGGLSLSRFLALLERRRKQNDPLSGGFSPSKDAVNILSIHKSKGLEWPFVILADAAHGFNFTDSRLPSMLFDRNSGAGLRYRTETDGPDSPLAIRATVQYRAIATHKERKTLSEEVRVLYVALTRAKQKVFVTAAVKDAEKALPPSLDAAPSAYALSTTKNYLTWLLLSLRGERNAAIEAARMESGYSDGRIDLFIVEPKEESEESQPEKIEYKTDPLVVEILRERVNYRYPRAALSAIPTKMSVSELSHDGDPPLRAPSFMAADGLGPAARGTAIHQFMQYADYAAAGRSVSEELARLKSGGYLLPEYADVIDIQKIERFFESDLARRVLEGNTLREYAFMDAVDASEIADLPEHLKGEKVMVQGIADCVIIEDDGVVLVDYKSDRVKTGNELVERYHIQLELYKKAIEKRLEMPVKESYIYSFALDEAVRL